MSASSTATGCGRKCAFKPSRKRPCGNCFSISTCATWPRACTPASVRPAPCALAAGDGEVIIEHLAWCSGAFRQLAAQDLYPRILKLGPSAGKRRQAVDMAQHLARGPGPVDPSFGLVDLGGIGDAVLALLLE